MPRPVLAWANTKVDARLTLPFTNATAARFAVRLTAATAPQNGIYGIELDGKPVVAAADFRAKEDEEADLPLGTHELAPGAHTLSFRALPVEGRGARPLGKR